MTYRYKNVSDQDQDIIGLGLVPAGAEFTTSIEINNPNFEKLGDTPAETPAAPAANDITEASE